MMSKPELHQESNGITKIDALEALEEYSPKIKWSDDDTMIDLGCGNGELTSIICKKIMNSKFKKVVGIDISEAMVQFANKHYKNERTSFMVFDMESELPKDLKGNFDHVVSIYSVQFSRKQEAIFSNVYNLLKDGGDCLLVFPSHTPVYDFYRKLARHEKWSRWLSNAEDCISPYQDVQEPEKQVTRMMEKLGFKEIEVKCNKKSYVGDIDFFRTTMALIDPFKIPEDLQKEYMDDFMKVVLDMKLIENVNDKPVVRIPYSLLVVYGRK